VDVDRQLFLGCSKIAGSGNGTKVRRTQLITADSDAEFVFPQSRNKERQRLLDTVGKNCRGERTEER
jgi:hypothetical protein